MDRISGANYVTIAGKRYWQDRNAGAGVPAGTFGNAAWMNGVQESIIEAVEAAGLAPTDADNTQLLQAIRLLGASQIVAFMTPGSFTWLPPATFTDGIVLVVGGGGAGGSGGGYAGFGGGSGGIAISAQTFAPGVTLNGYVAAGGVSDGGGGQPSAFNGVVATGGSNGGDGQASEYNGYGNFGQGTQGTVLINGSFGRSPIQTAGYEHGGDGAPGLFGNYGVGGLAGGVNGGHGYGPGGGGAGSTGTLAGGAGGPGLVLVWRG